MGKYTKAKVFGEVDDDLRKQIIQDFLNDKHKKQIANERNVKPSVVKRLVQMYRDSNSQVVASQNNAQQGLEGTSSTSTEKPIETTTPPIPPEPIHAAKKLTNKEILDIYHLLQKDMSTSNKEELAELYGVNISTIQHIAQQAHGYEWLKDHGPKLTDRSRCGPKKKGSLSKEKAIEIYNYMKDEDPSMEDVRSKYGISYTLIRSIRSQIGKYSFLKDIGGPVVAKKRTGNACFSRAIDDEAAIEILHAYMDDGMSTKDIMEKFNISYGTARTIKFCESAYEFLREHATPEYLKYIDSSQGRKSSISDESAIEIYNRSEKEKTISLAQEYNVSIQTILAIKNKRGRFAKIINAYKDGSIEITSSEGDKPNKPNPPKSAPKTSVVEFNEDIMVIPTKDAKTSFKDLDTHIKEIKAMEVLSNREPVVYYVKCGMIKDRHVMPVTEYIFDTLSSNLIGNYERMYEIAIERINELMSTDKSNLQTKGLSVYVTGFAPALVSVIKACMFLNTNLLLMHHNPKMNRYEPQDFTIHGSFNPCPEEMSLIANELYSYKCKAEHLFRVKNGFEILEQSTLSNGDGYRKITLIIDKDDAFDLYQSITVLNKTSAVNLNSVSIGSDGKYYRTNTILRNC